jgi:hypothetical protein
MRELPTSKTFWKVFQVSSLECETGSRVRFSMTIILVPILMTVPLAGNVENKLKVCSTNTMYEHCKRFKRKH